MHPHPVHSPQSPRLAYALRMTASASDRVNDHLHGILDKNQPVPGIESPRAAIDFIVSTFQLPAPPSAAARQSSIPSAANPRSSFLAHSHVLTRTATACRVRQPSHAHVHAARVDNMIVKSPNQYQVHSTPRRFHAGYMPISLSNSSFLRRISTVHTHFLKPFKPLAGIETARSAITLEAAAQISSSNDAQLQAGRNVSLSTVTTASSESLIFNARNRQAASQTQEVGSQIQAGGNLNIIAGQDISARAANVQATGDLALQAGQDIRIEAGQASQSQSSYLQVRRSGTFSSTTRTVDAKVSQTNAIESSLGGQNHHPRFQARHPNQRQHRDCRSRCHHRGRP
jgi:Hemagglutinin repeat